MPTTADMAFKMRLSLTTPAFGGIGAGLERHLKAEGAAKIILTAPGKEEVPNVVYGVNNHAILDGEKIVSAASCTTNAIVPVLKVMHDRFQIEEGHIETCHAYTNDQNLIDNYHKKSRRGRGAPLNMGYYRNRRC